MPSRERLRHGHLGGHDVADPKRTSAATGTLRFATWLHKMRRRMTSRAYHGARGWAFAKLVRGERGRLAALRFTIPAILRGCYPLKLVPVVLLQVVLDARQYRLLADTGIRWLHMGLREKPVAPASTHKARIA